MERVLADAQDAMERKYELTARGLDLEQLIIYVARLFSITPESIYGPWKSRHIVKENSTSSKD